MRRNGDRRWLSGFILFGSLLILPGLLPIIKNLNPDADPRQIAAQFLAFNLGFLLAWASSSPLLKKFGVRPLAVSGFLIAITCLITLALPPALISFWWEFTLATAMGTAAGAISISCLSALKPWSSRFAARALPRVLELSCSGCIFSSIVGSAFYGAGWERFTPVPIAAGALLCLLLCVGGRRPLAVIEKRNRPVDPRLRQLRSIASFLLLCLLFVQFGSEWAVAGWLPLYLIHRLGSSPSVALLVLGFYFLALLLARSLTGRIGATLGTRALAICGAVLALAGCLTLGMSTSIHGILLGLAALSIGFAPPYSIVKDTLDESLHLAPGFYRAILSVAVTGAMGSAWLLGYVHQFLGIGALPLFPAAGCLAVLILELLLIFESHLMGERTPARPEITSADRRTS